MLRNKLAFCKNSDWFRIWFKNPMKKPKSETEILPQWVTFNFKASSFSLSKSKNEQKWPKIRPEQKSSIFFATTGKCNFSLFSPIGFLPLTLFCFTFVCVPFMSIKTYFKSKKKHFIKSIYCEKVTIFTSVYDV